MNADQLRVFFHRSREWSRAKRGLELFEMAAVDLADVAEVDSGFFVYRKRAFLQGVTVLEPTVYAPWGVFAKEQDALSILLEKTMLHLDVLSPMMERWILAEDMPPQLSTAWEKYDLLEIGIWPLVSRERMTGAVVATRTKAVSSQLSLETGTALLDACGAQLSLALDLILAGRIAEEASQRDLLTGLLNRRGLEVRLTKLLMDSDAAGKYVVFGLIDLDDLKAVNDSQGHPAGDIVLQQVGSIIRDAVGDTGLVARFGGDEFAVALQVDAPDAASAMQRIERAVSSQADGRSVSAGGAVWQLEGDSLDACYQMADLRLYDSKSRRKASQPSK